jgi:NAD(P)-dependent dehydrogenase (short-subunit alcohol dehydrogenase family)
MSPYTFVITGANRGLGFELAKQLSVKPNVLVIGTARNTGAAKELSALPNTKVVQMDIGDYDSIKKAAKEVEKLAPEGIDELWNVRATPMLMTYMC